MGLTRTGVIVGLCIAGGLMAFKLYPVVNNKINSPKKVDLISYRHPVSQHIIDRHSPADPWAKAIGDFDGDGVGDLIVAGSHGPLVMYRSGGKDKTVIGSRNSYYTESGIALGDIDNDGDIDIVFGGVWLENPRPNGNVAVLWALHSIGAPAMNHNIELADLNKDGNLDIIMRGETSSLVTILIHNPSGLWSMKTLEPDAGRNGLAVKDLNGDTFLDIIVPGVWLENPRGNVFAKEWEIHSFTSWNEYAAIDTGDIDGDGRPDIVMSVSEQAGKISWFKNSGDRRSHWEEHVVDEGPVDSAHALHLEDMDGDDLLDVVTSEFRGDGRLLVYHQKDQRRSWGRQVLGVPFLHNVVVGDLDNDGDQDIAGTMTFDRGNVEVWENRLTTLDQPRSAAPRLLVFWKTDIAFHESIPDAIRVIREMAQKNRIEVDDTSDAHRLEDAVLARYQAVIFLSTQGEILNSDQRAAFERYIKAGGGFVGIHSAADTESNWSWYGKLVGSRYGGSHSATVRGMIQVEESTHVSTKELPKAWGRLDEWYNFSPNPRENGVTVLLTLDENTYEGGNMRGDHPVAWYHEYDGGRSWYTAGGASPESWADHHFKSHVWGGIQYAARFPKKHS
jgi:type 1 glutamine amidotransferase